MATVWIPSLMRELTGGQTTVTAAGTTVRQIVDNLEAAYPGIRERLCDGDRLHPSINVSVDGVVGRLGLRQPVGESSEVHFIPAVGGGGRQPPAQYPPAPLTGAGRCGDEGER
ncbi:MAG TPA: MoaD/ThiS family protein [Chloroflexota bacterium]|nr:MoaD/ThiS family protein [Chloroflexota bacterium]